MQDSYDVVIVGGGDDRGGLGGVASDFGSRV